MQIRLATEQEERPAGRLLPSLCIVTGLDAANLIIELLDQGEGRPCCYGVDEDETLSKANPLLP